MRYRASGRRALLAGSLVLCANAGAAQQPSTEQPSPGSGGVPGAAPGTQQNPAPGGGNGVAAQTQPSPFEPGFTSDLFSSSRTNLLGDLYGLRGWLGDFGISFGVLETSEVFGNVTGGLGRYRRL